MKRSVLLLTALRSILAHPARSGLTVLGIVIGVASVIAVVAVGAGSREEMEERLQSIGANLLLVDVDSDAISQGRTPVLLTSDDAAAIEREIPGLAAVAPSVFQRERVIRGNRSRLTTVQGITNEYLLAREWPLLQGRQFTSQDLDGAGKVALLGVTVRQDLFGTQSPLNRVIRIGNMPFTVIGTVAEKGLSSAGSDQDDRVFVPLVTAQHFLDGSRDARRGKLDYIMLKVQREARLDPAREEIKALLSQRHGNMSWEDTRLEVRDLSEALQTRREASEVFGKSLLAVALISLIVGGISVMNIMLVAVSERTPEIGLRMALGARTRDIRNQFLLESLLLTLLAGLIGVAAGIFASHVIAYVAGWPVLVRIEGIVAGLASAVGAGVCFGLYPAIRASRLVPIEALRYE